MTHTTIIMLLWIGLDLGVCLLFTWWMVKRAIWKENVKARNQQLQSRERHCPHCESKL